MDTRTYLKSVLSEEEFLEWSIRRCETDFELRRSAEIEHERKARRMVTFMRYIAQYLLMYCLGLGALNFLVVQCVGHVPLHIFKFTLFMSIFYGIVGLVIHKEPMDYVPVCIVVFGVELLLGVVLVLMLVAESAH